jgi:transcriptional regulator with XRE-family HTH domain
LSVNENYEKTLVVIGHRIKKQRLTQGLTQSELSALIDCEIKSIQRIEKGKMNMSLKLFISLSEALDISPEELLTNLTKSPGETSN